MASIRIGIASEFNLVDSKVGVGTTNPTEAMDVRGQIYSDNSIGAGGISTVTTYQGFLDTKQTIKSSVSEGTVVAGSLSGEIVIEGEVTVSSGTTYRSGVDDLTVTDNFTLPGISDDTPSVGDIRFNENLGTIQVFVGGPEEPVTGAGGTSSPYFPRWRSMNSYVDMGNRGRAVWMGGNETSVTGSQNDHCPTTDYVQIQTLGNAIDFGDLNQSTAQNSSYGSSIEAFSNGFGQSSTQQNYIQNVKFATGGNFQDFGDLTRVVRMSGSSNSSTRGVTGGGAGPSNVIDYLELQTKGNSVDFGDLLVARRPTNCTFSSPTRGVFAGGGPSNNIEYIIFASKGNGIDFGGVCTFAGGYKASSSSTTRGIQGGGAPDYTPAIETHEIASGGNAVHFGELTHSRLGANGASTQTRAVFGGGGVSPDAANRRNWIDYVTISSSGNAADFGDLTSKRCMGACTSDSHGGLGGF